MVLLAVLSLGTLRLGTAQAASPTGPGPCDEEAVATLDLLLSLGLDLHATNEAGDSALHAAIAGRGSTSSR